MSNILEVKDLCYKNIFDHLNLTINENSINCIIGSNNCGKTTLIRIICGKIPVKNCIISDKLNKEVCFYNNNDIDKTVKEVILYNVKKRNKIRNRLEYLINLFNIGNLLNEKVKSINNYNKVKVALCTTLINEPHLVLLDNIFDYITYTEYEELINILRSLQATVLFTTNKLDNTLLCDKVIVLGENKVFMEGTPIDILKHDNTLTKLGINIPIMMDVSLKLKCYDLVDEIILDPERLVNTLWK